MIKEYYNFIKEYLDLIELKTKYIVITFASSFFYKVFMLLLPFFASGIIKYVTLQDSELTYLFIVAYAVTYILSNLSLLINYKIYTVCIKYTYNNLTTKILNKLVTVDSNFSRFITKGRLMNSINADVIQIGDMNDRVTEVILGVLQIVTLLIIVLVYNIYIFFVFIIFAFVYIHVRNEADRKCNYYFNKDIVLEDKYSNLLTQTLNGLQEVKTFNFLVKLKNKLGLMQKNYNKYYSLKYKYIMKRDNDIKAYIYIFRSVLYILLLIFMFQGMIDVSGLVLIISYHVYIIGYINELIDCTSTIREVNVAVNRVNDILNYNSNVIKFGNNMTDDICGIIEFKNVSLRINNKLILNNINFKINHNEVVAIVGEAGSGKTMLLNMLLRLYEPTKENNKVGKILLDGINIYDFDKKIYYRNVSVVNQKPFIFNVSIRKNLNFVDTNISHQIEACKKAGIHDFIETLPNGYNTILRENGSNISGGQKQMISIARTLLSDAEVLLLDDITTSIDPDTAKLVPKLLSNLKKSHTIIMITKKPELMQIADKIIVLDNGEVNDIGTHKQLISRNDIYASLHSRKSASRLVGVSND